MSKSRLISAGTIGLLVLHAFQAAWAGTAPVDNLPGPAVVGLVAAGVIGAIALSRSKR